jgi:hypothetical protein
MILADKKGRFVFEFIEELTESEMYDWVAYYKEQYEEMERERAKARMRR